MNGARGFPNFPTNWGAKEPQNLPNHSVVKIFQVSGVGFQNRRVLTHRGRHESSTEPVSETVNRQKKTYFGGV